jgi:hypothetical protein
MDRLSDDDKLRLAQALNEGWGPVGCGVGSYDPGPVDEVLAQIETKFSSPEPQYSTSWDGAAQTFVFDGEENLTMGQIVERLNSQQCEIDRLKTQPPPSEKVKTPLSFWLNPAEDVYTHKDGDPVDS